MKHAAAAMLLALGGNTTPSAVRQRALLQLCGACRKLVCAQRLLVIDSISVYLCVLSFRQDGFSGRMLRIELLFVASLRAFDTSSDCVVAVVSTV